MSQASKTLIRSLCSTIAAVVIAFGLLPTAALADSIDPYTLNISKLKGTLTIYRSNNSHKGFCLFTCKKGKLTKVKSSNAKVVEVRPWGDDWKDSSGITIVGLKKGKATITYTYKGKTRKVKVVVKKYSNPIKTLKIGKKNYAGKLKKYSSVNLAKWNACNGKKLSVTPAKNWKIVSIKCSYNNGDWSEHYAKKVKNGGKLPKAANGEVLVIVLKNTKNGGHQTIEARFIYPDPV